MVSTLRETLRRRPDEPPLENGDRLDAETFLRRYEAMPELKKAELVDGVVYMASPVRMDTHGEPHFRLMHWVTSYAMFTPGVRGGDNTTVRLDRENTPQPDALLYVPSESVGQARLGEDGILDGVPEFVAEVAASSVSLDLGPKLEVYRRHGVREYLVWRVYDEAIDWFRLQDGIFVPLPVKDSVVMSEEFPGLWLNEPAMLAGDMKAVFETLQRGVATTEHAVFLQRLAAAGDKR